MTVVAADIGGTHSRFIWKSDADVPHPEFRRSDFLNSEFSDFYLVLNQLMAELTAMNEAIKVMVLAVPAPVDGCDVALTNINWCINSEYIERHYGIEKVYLINDFQAAATGLIHAPDDALITINQGQYDADAPVVVAGAGTGLGMAWLCNRHQNRLPQSTEGGHVDFAPNTLIESELYRDLHQRLGHVSYERLLCGDGLVNIYRFLSLKDSSTITPKRIVALAQKQDPYALETITLFFRILAAYAGNLALLFNPKGGIYLCGGIVFHLLKWLDQEAFIQAYTNKGRMEKIALSTPLLLSVDEAPGVMGAMRVASHLKDYGL